jgi:hypothetical protein
VEFQQIECLAQAISDTWWRPQLSAVGRNHIKSAPRVQEASKQNDLRGLNIMKMCRNLSKSHKYPCEKRANHWKARLTHLVVSGSGSRLCHHQGTILPAPWFTWLFSPTLKTAIAPNMCTQIHRGQASSIQLQIYTHPLVVQFWTKLDSFPVLATKLIAGNSWW